MPNQWNVPLAADLVNRYTAIDTAPVNEPLARRALTWSIRARYAGRTEASPHVHITLNGEPYELERPMTCWRCWRGSTSTRAASPSSTTSRSSSAARSSRQWSRRATGGDRQRGAAAGSHRSTMDTPFVIAGRTFRSRLIVGTGKYSSHAVMRAGARSVGRRHGHRRRPAREHLGPVARVAAGLHRRRSASSSCRTPPAATPPTRRSAPRSSAARRASATG